MAPARRCRLTEAGCELIVLSEGALSQPSRLDEMGPSGSLNSIFF